MSHEAVPLPDGPATQSGIAAPTSRHPLLERLVSQYGYPEICAESFAEFVAPADPALLFLAEDPARIKETLDLAVILPELAAVHPRRFRIGVLPPAEAAVVAPKYAIRRWPALLMMRAGRYVGAIEGLRNWDDYLAELARLLELEPSIPSVLVVPLASPRREAGSCHDP